MVLEGGERVEGACVVLQPAGEVPLTSFGLVGVRGEDAGAASGLVNTAHQLGTATGPAVLVAVSANAGDLTTRVSAAYAFGTGLLALCLVVVLLGHPPQT